MPTAPPPPVLLEAEVLIKNMPGPEKAKHTDERLGGETAKPLNQDDKVWHSDQDGKVWGNGIRQWFWK